MKGFEKEIERATDITDASVIDFKSIGFIVCRILELREKGLKSSHFIEKEERLR